VFVTVLPETGKIADGISRALRGVDDDVRRAAKRWRDDIKAELGKDVEIDIDADTGPAKRELDKLEREKRTATVKVDVDVDQASRRPAHCSAAPRNSKAPSAGISLAPNIVPAVGSVVSAVG
jgi:hypothetical protein